MVKIKVLLENSTCDDSLTPAHGLSLLIEHNNHKLLLDAGPDALFAKNAAIMGVDLKGVSELVLSHSHRDHTGGINAFAALNSQGRIYLFDSPSNRYYFKLFGVLPLNVGLRASPSARSRLTRLEQDHQLSESIWFIRNNSCLFPAPSLNRTLYRKDGRRLVQDEFTHEGILAIVDDGELVLFNSCSHSGLCNSIESARKIFGRVRKIKAYVGGLHFHNPAGSGNESLGNMDKVCDYIQESRVKVYTGHCTGNANFEYLERRLGDRIERLSTGAAFCI